MRYLILDIEQFKIVQYLYRQKYNTPPLVPLPEMGSFASASSAQVMVGGWILPQKKDWSTSGPAALRRVK
jgi:hypothetical protein